MPSEEVPSSSPNYTPLQPLKHKILEPITPERLNIIDGTDSKVPYARQELKGATRVRSDASTNHELDASVNQNYESLDIFNPHNSNEDTSDPPEQSSGYAPTPSSNPPDMTFDFNETVDTDSDWEEGKSTQHYLDGLLTESLMETLPMPPEKREHLRRLCGEGQCTKDNK